MNATAIGESLHRLLHAYKRALREGYAAAGIELTVSEIRVLKSIARAAQCTAQTIAERMLQDKARIARLIKSLQSAGLIDRQPHPADSRSQQLTLTVAGERLYRRIVDIETEAGQRMGAGLSENELTHFIGLANAMAANLDQREQTP
ncbi:MarR family transcriptional regulator [Salinisphaera sp. SPP-AMP-43]|uniref:MarR family winged helix-turn-helix transcriptional regulator n=1 Tax=Salinisphaera sp. SPP-AMP-43 TaxID=3121288 RepID=UPI003C6E8FE1